MKIAGLFLMLCAAFLFVFNLLVISLDFKANWLPCLLIFFFDFGIGYMGAILFDWNKGLEKKKELHQEPVNQLQFDCIDYLVETQVSQGPDEYWSTLKFIDKKTGNFCPCPGTYNVQFFPDSQGVQIKWKDSWGNSWTTKQFPPVNHKGMFDFIGRGHKVFEVLESMN